MNATLQSTMGKLRLGAPLTFKNLTVIPLFDEALNPLDYLSLKTALAKGLAVVTEVDESGSVPELKVFNKSPLPILIIDGEELIGAKQNRIANTSILLKANSETLIPVSCTESGRWNYNSDSFSSSDSMMYASSRSAKSSRVYESMKGGRGYEANQSQVWAEVAELHDSVGTRSRSSAMSDAYEQKKEDLSDFVHAFPLFDHQKGMIVFVNGKVQAADYISKPEAYADVHEKLIKSFAIESLSKSQSTTEKALTETDALIEAGQWLNNLPKTEESTFTPVGLGSDTRYDSVEQGAAALMYADSVVHLSVFNKTHNESSRASRHGFSRQR
jgi:hypothetical protein